MQCGRSRHRGRAVRFSSLLILVGLSACVTANTGEAELTWPQRVAGVGVIATTLVLWERCPKVVDVLHRIVTHDTPRARDLHGMLTLKRTGGDPAVVSMRLWSVSWVPFPLGPIFLPMVGRPYALGTPIPVVEPGHVGGGEHTWHAGHQQFLFEAVKSGFVDIEANVDPDPEVPEGDGRPTKTVKFTVVVPEVRRIYIADKSDWSRDLDWKEVLLSSDPLRVVIEVTPPITVPEDLPCSLRARTRGTQVPGHGTAPFGVDVPVTPANATIAPGGRRIHVTVSPAELSRLRVTTQGSDSTDEFVTADLVDNTNPRLRSPGSNRNDGDLVDPGWRGRGWVQRGKARSTVRSRWDAAQDGNSRATPPEGSVNLSFMKAAGVELVEVELQGVPSESRMIQNQADFLYYSGHGLHSDPPGVGAGVGVPVERGASLKVMDATGSAPYILSPNAIGQEWKQDLKQVFFSGCAVLDIKDYNNNYRGAEHTDSPGEKWVTTGPKVLHGYNATAPLDDNVGNPQYTATIFAKYAMYLRQGQTEAQAWGNANKDMGNQPPDNTVAAGRAWNACCIDLRPTPAEYWYFDKAAGYVWKKVPAPW